MKKQETTKKERFRVVVDKRELVNIDLYDHEIKSIVERLEKISKKHPRSKVVDQKVEHFKEELRVQQKNLENFQKDCEPEEMNSGMEPGEKIEQLLDKSFFEKLRMFENQFKMVRQEANEFVTQMEMD